MNNLRLLQHLTDLDPAIAKFVRVERGKTGADAKHVFEMDEGMAEFRAFTFAEELDFGYFSEILEIRLGGLMGHFSR